MKVNEKKKEKGKNGKQKSRKETQESCERNQPRKKFPRVTKEIINQKIEKKNPTKIKEEKKKTWKKKEEREKFEINLQIQPFDFEISCSKYQNSFCYSKKSCI